MMQDKLTQVARYLDEQVAEIVAKIPANDREKINELRLRTSRPLSAVISGKSMFVGANGAIISSSEAGYICTSSQLERTFAKLCRNSVYAYTEELKHGFITLTGGHRAGLSGKTVVENGEIVGLREISGIAIRIASQRVGSSKNILPLFFQNGRICSGLVISPPGGGKTTVLRDMARSFSYMGYKVAVIDERSEIGGMDNGSAANDLGPLCDVLDGCPKAKGIIWAVRCLSPQVIIIDELGSENEANAVLSGLNAGVPVIMSLHAGTLEQAFLRPVLRRLLSSMALDVAVLLDGADNPGRVLEKVKLSDYFKTEKRENENYGNFDAVFVGGADGLYQGAVAENQGK